MIIEIVLGILVITEAYIIWNLNTKTETLETWMESFSNSVYQIQSDLKDIDSRGHFEADDEVGFFFEEIKLLSSDLEELFEPLDEVEDAPSKEKKEKK